MKDYSKGINYAWAGLFGIVGGFCLERQDFWIGTVLIGMCIATAVGTYLGPNPK